MPGICGIGGEEEELGTPIPASDYRYKKSGDTIIQMLQRVLSPMLNRVAASGKAAKMKNMSIDDAAFWAYCPDVETDPEKMGGTPTVGPYRLAAETVVHCGEDGLTPKEIVEIYPGTPVDKVASILNYYWAHQAELTPAR